MSKADWDAAKKCKYSHLIPDPLSREHLEHKRRQMCAVQGLALMAAVAASLTSSAKPLPPASALTYWLTT